MDVDREKVIRRVMRTVAREQARSPLPVRLEDGSSPLVVALPGDSVADVFERVGGFGGSANLIVAYAERLKLLSIELNASSETREPADVHPVASIGMLCDWLDCTPDGSAQIRINDAFAAPPVVRELAYAF